MNIFINTKDTICAISSPSGVGAIALIRLSGSKAVDMANQLFSKEIKQAEGYSVHYGTIAENKIIIDEVVLTLFRAPHSFTGEDSIEIACHGSLYIQQKIVALLLDAGARLAEPGEFSKRAFSNGKMDLTQTEAIIDLIHSESEQSHKLAMNQMRGGISNELQQLREQLVNFASLIELELDFSEEDVAFADRRELEHLVKNILAKVQKLIQSFAYGNAIKNGVQTVIAGRPNAGKSTLLNALLNEDRALVSDIPGTTRDTIEEKLNIDGIAFRLIDTAGIREAQDQIEAMGIQKTMEKVKQSSILLYVHDSFEDPIQVEKDLNGMDTSNTKVIIVTNKWDEYTPLHDNPAHNMMIWRTEQGWDDTYKRLESNYFDVLYWVSAKEKQHLDKVKDALGKVILEDRVSSNQVVISNLRHLEALKQANESLTLVANGLNEKVPEDLLAIDIRKSLHHLGEITGEVTTEDLLGNIFANFCIGK